VIDYCGCKDSANYQNLQTFGELFTVMLQISPYDLQFVPAFLHHRYTMHCGSVQGYKTALHLYEPFCLATKNLCTSAKDFCKLTKPLCTSANALCKVAKPFCTSANALCKVAKPFCTSGLAHRITTNLLAQMRIAQPQTTKEQNNKRTKQQNK